MSNTNTIQETYSSALVNYSEPRTINGIQYTRFYTELNTELSVGDFVYILNGNYDNTDLININEYQQGTTGYEVLEIDRNSITLDILYRDEDPWNKDPFADYTKVYVVEDEQKFNYENIDNSFGFEGQSGDKYSIFNNNIFLSQIENMEFTQETGTNQRFFKSFFEPERTLRMFDMRGQLFNDSTELKFDLDELEEYSLVEPNGVSGSTYARFSSGQNNVRDFDIVTHYEYGGSDVIERLATLNSSNSNTNTVNLWTLNKSTLDQLSDVTLRDSLDTEDVSANILSPFIKNNAVDIISSGTVFIKLPKYSGNFYSFLRSIGTGQLLTNTARNYSIVGINQTMIVGYDNPSFENNYRAFGFYNTDDTFSLQFISPDLQDTNWTTPNGAGYIDGNTQSTPYFALSSGVTGSYNYTGDYVFPQQQIFGTRVHGNIVPPYAKYSGIGRAVQIETNTWENSEEDSAHHEIALAGTGLTSSVAPLQGGVYFYSYAGVWRDYDNDYNGNKILGNAFDLSKNTFDEYKTGSWSQSSFNPFDDFDDYPFADLKDIKFLGYEKKDLGLNLYYDNNGNPVDSSLNTFSALNTIGGGFGGFNIPIEFESNGVYYSRYLVVTENGGSYIINLSFNSVLLAVNSDFLDDMLNGLPQVHVVIEEIDDELERPTQIGQKRDLDVFGFPEIIGGDYPIVSIYGSHSYYDSINGTFSGFDFRDINISTIDFNDQRWLIGSSNLSPRLSNSTLLPIEANEGVYVFDRSINDTTYEFNITTTTEFDTGDFLPSNRIHKILGEIINDKRRVWVATNTGLFVFDYDLEYTFDYYFRINFDDNEIELDESLYKNDRLYIMEDFIYDGEIFEKDKIYRHLKDEKRWVRDTTYERSYLTKAHMKDGTILDATFNDGIFGNKDTVANWEGATWRNGILYNADWDSGIMASKSDEILGQNYYATLDNNEVKISTDFTNNEGYGYNLVNFSTLKTGEILNGTILNTTIGLTVSNRLLDETYKGLSFSYNDLEIVKSKIEDSSTNAIQLGNSMVSRSDLNSTFINDAQLINNNVYDSIINSATIENQGNIKILAYEKWFNIRTKTEQQDILQVHKFFINEEDLNKLSYDDWVIFNNVQLSNNSPSNILDKLFYVLGGDDGYYQDIYEDLNRVFNDKYKENSFKVFISKRLETQNRLRTSIRFNGVQLVVDKSENDNPRYSIDLNIVTNEIPYNSDPSIYLNALENDGVLKVSATNINNAVLQHYHFKNSWINGGTWLNGSIIQPDQLNSLYNYGSVSSTNDNVLIDLYDTNYEIKSDEILGNEVVYINNIWDSNFLTYSGGNFMIISGTSTRVLEPYGDFATNATLSVPMSQYTTLNLNRIDGIDNNLSIESGVFKNQSFSNLSIQNEELNVRNLNYQNIRNLMVINSEITKRNNLEIQDIFMGYGHISNDFSNKEEFELDLISFKQTLTNVNVTDGIVSKSAFISGTFSNGIFTNNRYRDINDLIPINNRTYAPTQSALLSSWHFGNFLNGEVSDSTWLNGTFSNGIFLNSEFLGGIWANGEFGDISGRPTLNLFRKGLWLNGTFNNGIFGDDIKEVGSINTIYTDNKYILESNIYIKEGTNIWEQGNFNNGVLTSINNNPTLWRDGKFNNGKVSGSVIWYDGIFNNGKFSSQYGRQVANVAGEINLVSIADGTGSDGSRTVNLFGNTASVPFLDQYSIASIRDIDASNPNLFNNPGTIVLDTSDNQLKFGYVSSTTSNTVFEPFDTNLSSHGFTEKAAEDFFTGTIPSLYMQFKPLNYAAIGTRVHPLKDVNILGARIFVQDTSNEYIYDGTSYVPKDDFLGATISGTSLTYSTYYPWRTGVFNEGEFGLANNPNNANPSWESGTFNGGVFNGKIWKNGTFVKGQFNGSGTEQFQSSSTNIFKGYDPQASIEEYIDDYSLSFIAPQNQGQGSYKVILDKYNWFGVWLGGEVSPNISGVSVALSNLESLVANVTPNLNFGLESAFAPSANNTSVSDALSNNSGLLTNASVLSSPVRENILVEYFNEDKYNRRLNKRPVFDKMLWVDGIFNNADGEFNKSVWLSGSMRNGTFKNSMFNPYVQRWEFESGDLNNIEFKFDLDTENTIWENGVFDSGIFFFSDWENGTFENGVMVGGNFMGGRANYMSAYSTIWEGGRFRNGNWFGSNFTFDNIYNDSSIPNPFEYLRNYFANIQFAPFVTDILGNNSKRLQDDRLHIWNIIEGDITNSAYNLTGHDFGTDGGSQIINNGTVDVNNLYSLTDVTSNPLSGIYELELSISQLPSVFATYDYIVNFTLVDQKRYDEGVYEITFYTDGDFWSPASTINSTVFELYADIYENGILTDPNVLLKEIPQGAFKNVRKSFEVSENQEYVLKVEARMSVDNGVYTEKYFLAVEQVDADVVYSNKNNELEGSIELNWEGSYLSSTISTTSASLVYTNTLSLEDTIRYTSLDVSTISIPTVYKDYSGAYSQFGNGTFQSGIYENGIWNNGYRGTEYGLYIVGDDDDYPGATLSYEHLGGVSSTVETNPLYSDVPQVKYRTEPIVYFNRVQRSFKVGRRRWRFVLESAFDIDAANNTEEYNRLRVSDQVSISNIVAIDINGNRKLIKDVFRIIRIPNRNRIIVEYQETFPIDSIQIDSDRHLIAVSKNVWFNGAFLNGYFKGNMINGFIRGNRNITKIEDSQLIDVDFKGGHFVSKKYPVSDIFDTRTSNALSLSPQFTEKYNSLYHSGVIQNMTFDDDVTLTNYELYSAEGVRINGIGIGDPKNITFGATAPSEALQYIYNSDMDLVYEPEYYSSVFNQNIINTHAINELEIGEFIPTKLYNIPAGYITYDILNSVSNFKYSTEPNDIDGVIEYKLSLGSKYKIFNDIFNVDFSQSPNNDPDIDSPSTFNIVESATYGIFRQGSISDGINFNQQESQFVHEDFMYIFDTSSNVTEKIIGDNSFKIRNRYHLVEVDVEFANQIVPNPYNITENVSIGTTYSYGTFSLPKLSIGQAYNEYFENINLGGTSGYISSYDNDMVGFIDGTKLSEINNFGNIGDSKRITMKSFMYNNFGGYRDSVRVIEKGFNVDTGSTSSNYIIKSPIYYKFNHYEIDKIPFYDYRSYVDPLSGEISDWNRLANQDETRRIDDRIKTPFYASSVPIDYQDSNFVLTDNINFLGGSNITGNVIIEEVDTLAAATLQDILDFLASQNQVSGGLGGPLGGGGGDF